MGGLIPLLAVAMFLGGSIGAAWATRRRKWRLRVMLSTIEHRGETLGTGTVYAEPVALDEPDDEPACEVCGRLE